MSKKKQKKRRNKKNKINNGTMGLKPSDSSHMTGYSTSIAVATQQLQQANLNKHIKEINDNNEKVRIQHEPNNLEPNDPEVHFFNQVKEGVKSGKLKVSKTQTGFTVVDKSLAKKPGPKTNSRGRVFEMSPAKVSSGLFNNTSRNMNRDYFNVMGDFLGDNIVGSLNKGASSDKFLVEEELQGLDSTQPTIELDNNESEAPNIETAAIVQEEEQQMEPLDSIDEVVGSTSTNLQENAKIVPLYEPKLESTYT